MLILVLAVTLLGGIATMGLAAADRGGAVRVLGLTTSATATLVGLLTSGLLIWAHTATDTSQLARTLVWGASSFGDQHRFPARVIGAGGDIRPLGTGRSCGLDAIRTDGGLSLDEALAANSTTAFLVLDGSDLVHESYHNGSGPDDLQTSFSVAKSIVSALVGIAIDEGLIDGLDQPITALVGDLAEADPRFGDITIRHLLTMSSGLSFDDGGGPWDDPANTYHGTDLRRAAVSTPRIAGPPGTTFHYNDWNVILLGLAIEEASGTTIADYATTRLWQPMGAEADGSWSLDSVGSGFEKSFVGVNARARDFARFGLLVRDGGAFDGRAVVPPHFIDEATGTDATIGPARDYRYLWWIDESRQSFYANGDHGQFIYIDPQADVVIVRHGAGTGDLDWVGFLGRIAGIVERSRRPVGSGGGASC